MQLLDGATDASGSASYYPGQSLSGTVRVQPSGAGGVTVDLLATLTPDEAGTGSSLLDSGPVVVTAGGAIFQYANRKLYKVTLVYSGLPGPQTLDAWANVYDEPHVQRLAW